METVMKPLQEKLSVELSMIWPFGFMPPDDRCGLVGMVVVEDLTKMSYEEVCYVAT
jgi:hypothetical protein